MRVLVLTAKAIWPLLGGAEIRNFNLMKETSKYHEVYLLSFLLGRNDRDNFSGLQPYCKKVIGIDLVRPKWKRMYKAATSLSGSRPFIISEYHRREMAQTLARVIEEENIDVVHAHFLHVGQYAAHKGRAAFVYDAHNLEHVLWGRFSKIQTNPLMRSFARKQLPKFVAWQQKVARLSEKIVTLSDDDKEEYLRIAPYADITTVPNGADIEFFQPLDMEIEENSIIYFANFGWPPQDDAALYFHNDVLPLVRKEVPGAKLYLVGKTPPGAIRNLACENVVVTGFVEDIREYIQRAAVVVLPLRVGAGTKHRVFQSLAMQKPLVTTSVGAEGIALEHGKTALITDDTAQLARHTIELLKDGDLRRRMGEAGRKLVVENYDWRSNYRILESVFQEAVEKKRTGRSASV